MTLSIPFQSYVLPIYHVSSLLGSIFLHTSIYPVAHSIDPASEDSLSAYASCAALPGRFQAHFANSTHQILACGEPLSSIPGRACASQAAFVALLFLMPNSFLAAMCLCLRVLFVALFCRSSLSTWQFPACVVIFALLLLLVRY